MLSSSSLLSTARRLVSVLFALFVAYRFYIWRRYAELVKASGLPVVPYHNKSLWNRPLANFLKQIENWHRIYDWKVETFKSMNGALTIALPAPIWTPEPIINSADPVVIRHILKDKFDVYIKPESTISCLRDILGNGIFAVNHGPHSEDQGHTWTLQRKTAAKVFTNNNFQSLMLETFSDHSQKIVKVIEAKLKASDAPIEMQTLMYRYTLDSIGRIGFGVDIDSLSKDVPFAQSFDRAQALSTQRFISPLWNVWPLGQLLYPGERELKGHIKVLDSFVYDIISKRKQELQRGDGSKGDILTLFLQEKLGLTDLELRDVVMSFLIAGRDTTACTLSFALMLLAEHPEWQEKLRQEVRAKLEEKKAKAPKERILTSADISQMKLLQNIVMETLRLYPPVPIDIKCAAVDDELPGGFKIPKGSRVSFEPYVMGRLEKFWGKTCLEFNPDRWLEKKTLPSPYDFPQFQAGPRICLGESLAKFEAALLLGVLVDRFDMQLPTPDTKYTYSPGITLTIKDGLFLKVKPLAIPA